MHRRHIAPDAACPCCNAASEDLLHCLLHCPNAKRLWDAFGFDPPFFDGPSGHMLRWIRDMLNAHGPLFPVIMWTVWRARNMMIFDNVKETLHSMQARVVSLCHFIAKAYAVDPPSTLTGVAPRSVSWKPPDEGVVVLNVDGSALSNPGQAGFGGLVRNSSGKFLLSFYGSLGVSDIMHAEVVALLRGIMLCWEAGYRAVVCYTDSLNMVKMVTDRVPIYHREANKLQLIKACLARDWNVQIYHSWREGN